MSSPRGVLEVQTPSPATGGSPRIADRLVAARRGRFVGREAELQLFRSALLAPEPPFSVLHVYGPGGIGKTTLVQEYARIAQDAGRTVVRLDVRNLDPVPDAFLASLAQALGLSREAPFSAAAHWPAGGVLIVDTYESIPALDPWLRDELLPQLPAQSLVVLAGRQTPAAAWTTDIAWSPLTRILALRNLRPEESETYLTVRGVPAARHAEVLAATYGHPLALSLAAYTLEREEGAAFDLGSDPDIVRVLLEKFVQDVPSAQHRVALYACASVTAITEPVLAAALAVEDAHEVFDWLARLTFVEHGPQGLFPHDLAREVLYADSRWRNLDQRRLLNERLLTYLYGRFQQSSGIEQQRIWFDIIYLQRYNPGLRPYFAWNTMGSAFAEPLRPEDVEQILGMAERQDGPASRDIARYWIDRQPEGFLAVRSVTGGILGFMAHVRLEHATEADRRADPAVDAALGYVDRHGPLRPGEGIAYMRFWVSEEGEQRRGASTGVIAANCSLYWTSHPDLAWNFIAIPDWEYMATTLTSIHIWRSPEADFEVGGRHYGTFAHDWRVEPIAAWIRAKIDRATDIDPAAEPPADSPPLLVLSQTDFAEAVRQALRDHTRPDRLVANPLMRTRLVREVDPAGRPETLRDLLSEAASALDGNPKDRKWHQALWHTFLEPAATQERAAELLGVPFNTYRYHLAKGIERVTEWLWDRELGGAPARLQAQAPGGRRAPSAP